MYLEPKLGQIAGDVPCGTVANCQLVVSSDRRRTSFNCAGRLPIPKGVRIDRAILRLTYQSGQIPRSSMVKVKENNRLVHKKIEQVETVAQGNVHRDVTTLVAELPKTSAWSGGFSFDIANDIGATSLHASLEVHFT